MKKRLLTSIISTVVLLGLAGAVALRATLFRTRLPASERGRRIAEREGCFACHGPGGTGGVPNPGHREAAVPGFTEGGEHEAHERGHAGGLPGETQAMGEELIRQWIRDGVPEDKARSGEWRAARDDASIAMPAFGEKLDESEIDDLVAFVRAMGAGAPSGALERRGFERARELGCFGCHGSGGRLAPPNPGSLKGYIPSWDGSDFPDLVRDRGEFDQWVKRGISDRFDKSPFARVYLDRATIRMPAFSDRLGPGDLDALWAYVEWLRSPRP
ncbi:MAG: c-type cytochrome [Candidatus Krumholzibacteriia bacterium]